MSTSLTQAIEDYLKAIFKLQHHQNEVVTTGALAGQLDVAPASVTNMVKKLADNALVEYEPYQGFRLTPAGRDSALRVIRYHRLVELFLVKKLGVPWDQVHSQADIWEHSLSEYLAEKMEFVLGHPATDPHGAPIPTRDGDISQPYQHRLTDLEAGNSAFVTEVSDHDAGLLRYLGDLNLYPGTLVSVVDVAPVNRLLTIQVRQLIHVIGYQTANAVYITT